MKTSLILVLCLGLVYCADWNKFQEGTHTTIQLLQERLKSLLKHTEELAKKPEKESIAVVRDNVNDELGHLSDLEKNVKVELAKNHDLVSQEFFLKKTVATIYLLRTELNQLIKVLDEAEKKVGTTSAYFAATEAPVDYRQLYDHLLMESINEKIREAEQFLERISHQLIEFQTHHNEEVHAQIIRELNFVLPSLSGIEHHFDEELKKTGLNAFEKFFIQKAKSETLLLKQALTLIENAVKVHTMPASKAPVFFAATEAPADWRQAYDQLLFSFINEHIVRADGALLHLQRELKEYQTTKNKEIKDRIVNQVEREIPLLKATQEHAVRELKRTDLDYIERFLYEKSHDQTALLIKHYSQIEAEVKKTF
jgi:uncharacterized protein YdhG (YjbR/CyaY superfamily)